MIIKNSVQGLTLLGLMLILAIIGIIVAIAIPSYQSNSKRASYIEVVQATAPYKVGVTDCYQNQRTLVGCNAGSNNIPGEITISAGAVESLTVTNGVITVVPVAQNGITVADTYILTPIVVNNELTWRSSGGGVKAGFAK